MIKVKLEFPDYPRKVEISKARKTKYYTPIKPAKAKIYNNRAKYQYLNKPGDKGLFLYDLLTGLKVIANPKAQGTPKYETINAQSIYNQHMTSFTRAKIIIFLHKYFDDAFNENPKLLEVIKNMSIEAPLKMELEIHDTIKVENRSYWDTNNRSWFYVKAFEDVLVKKGILKDDNTLFIPRSCAPVHIPISDTNNRKLVFIISKEDDPRIINNEEHIKLRETYTKEPKKTKK